MKKSAFKVWFKFNCKLCCDGCNALKKHFEKSVFVFQTLKRLKGSSQS